MRITGADTRPWSATPARPVGAVGARQTHREGLLLHLHDASGRVGVGEASPLPGYSPETLDGCRRALRDVHRALPGVFDPMHPLAGTRGLCADTPAARCALETALLDLAGQHRGIPLAEVLGGSAAVRPVPLHGQPGAALDPDLVARARALLAAGYTTLKVKVGGDFTGELAALQALRKAVGADVALRLDANGAWTLATVHARMAALRAVAPAFIEQPVAGAALLALGDCAVPWAADECLTDPDGVRALLDPVHAVPRTGCVAVVVKPMVLGLVGARDVALRAQAVGLGVVVTHCFDGAVGVAAACALALSLTVPPWACGLGPHPAMVRGLPYHQGPWVVRSAAPGIGVGTD